MLSQPTTVGLLAYERTCAPGRSGPSSARIRTCRRRGQRPSGGPAQGHVSAVRPSPRVLGPEPPSESCVRGESVFEFRGR